MKMRIFITVSLLIFIFFLGVFSDRIYLVSKDYILKPVKINKKAIGTYAEYLNSAYGIKIGSFTVLHTTTGSESLVIGTDDNNPSGIVIERNDKKRTDVHISDMRNHIIQSVFNNGNLVMTSITKDVVSENQYTQVIDSHANGIYNMIFRFSKSGIEKLLLVGELWYPFETKNNIKMVLTKDGWQEVVDDKGIIKLITGGAMKRTNQ